MVAREKKDRLYASVVARYGVDIFLLSLLMAAAEREREIVMFPLTKSVTILFVNDRFLPFVNGNGNVTF